MTGPSLSPKISPTSRRRLSCRFDCAFFRTITKPFTSSLNPFSILLSSGQKQGLEILIHEDVSSVRAVNLSDLLTAPSSVVKGTLGTQAVIHRYLLNE